MQSRPRSTHQLAMEAAKKIASIHNEVCVRLAWLTPSRARGASATARLYKSSYTQISLLSPSHYWYYLIMI